MQLVGSGDIRWWFLNWKQWCSPLCSCRAFPGWLQDLWFLWGQSCGESVFQVLEFIPGYGGDFGTLFSFCLRCARPGWMSCKNLLLNGTFDLSSMVTTLISRDPWISSFLLMLWLKDASRCTWSPACMVVVQREMMFLLLLWAEHPRTASHSAECSWDTTPATDSTIAAKIVDCCQVTPFIWGQIWWSIFICVVILLSGVGSILAHSSWQLSWNCRPCPWRLWEVIEACLEFVDAHSWDRRWCQYGKHLFLALVCWWSCYPLEWILCSVDEAHSGDPNDHKWQSSKMFSWNWGRSSLTSSWNSPTRCAADCCWSHTLTSHLCLRCSWSPSCRLPLWFCTFLVVSVRLRIPCLSKSRFGVMLPFLGGSLRQCLFKKFLMHGSTWEQWSVTPPTSVQLVLDAQWTLSTVSGTMQGEIGTTSWFLPWALFEGWEEGVSIPLRIMDPWSTRKMLWPVFSFHRAVTCNLLLPLWTRSSNRRVQLPLKLFWPPKLSLLACPNFEPCFARCDCVFFTPSWEDSRQNPAACSRVHCFHWCLLHHCPGRGLPQWGRVEVWAKGRHFAQWYRLLPYGCQTCWIKITKSKFLPKMRPHCNSMFASPKVTW